MYMYIFMYVSVRVVLYSDTSIMEQSSLHSKDGKILIIQGKSYVNHLVTTAGLLCRGTPMGKKH